MTSILRANCLKQHRSIAKFYFGKPLIENDILLVRNSTMKKVSNIFDKKVGIVSGRSRIAAEYSMKSIFKFFDIHGSFYLEDEKREMGKPDPSALIKSVKILESVMLFMLEILQRICSW